ncbi:MAG: ABC-F family ATP-binding cassette domain-containing protein [Bacteroidales bacterium]|nr:ABC-F family ATP-binding cassette domain-containing protein [Bacteroidales bacterium]MDD4671543.1 ABC-F family ATP-binding cassette domain-containing protein [Bacteroidales bacterium]
MVSLSQVTVSFGGFNLFNDVSLLVAPKERVGLVGKNGAGKSTLLKLIIGEMPPSSGEISVPRDLAIGYLPQQMDVANSRSVIDETMTAFSDILKLTKDIKKISKEIEQRTDYESEEYAELINSLAEKSERFSLLGGESLDAKAEVTLTGLGFKRTDFSRPTSEFSGGWRMRIELAKILLREPNILLLDEPTNHLDIESIGWFEDYLKAYSGALILISHDRAFLDNVTDRTIELSLGRAYDYKVPYSKYVELRNERRQQQLAAYKNQQKQIGETKEFIERFRYKATKANQVQSRIKQLEKLDIIEIDDEDNSALNIRFPEAPRAGDLVVKVNDVSKAYGSNTVFSDANFDILRGEKVAFVGRNGEGKTTLSKIIIGEIDYQGELKIGHNVSIGYFAQNQDELMNPNNTVLETIDRVAVGEIRTKIRDILGAFLFRGEDVDKRVSVLSGGERNRLAMVKLMLQPYNLLVLDEPTNHLDMRSKDILKEALINFKGTVIVVSHDREFLDGLVSKVYEFRDGNVKEHLGGIYNFLEKRKLENLKELETRKEAERSEKSNSGISNRKQEWLNRKEQDRIIRKVTSQIEKVETKINTLEEQIAEKDTILCNPANACINDDFFAEYEALKTKLNKTMHKWEQLHYELDILQEED